MAEQKSIVLFKYEQPDLIAGLGMKSVKNGQVVPAVSVLDAEVGKDSAAIILTMDNRKAVAKRLGVVMNKENGAKIDSEILRMKDDFMKVAATDMIKRVMSGDYTGASYRVTQAKGGKQKVAMSIERVDRGAHDISDEQVVKALANMTPEQRAKMEQKATEAANERRNPVIELESLLDASKADLPVKAEEVE